jgi:hypothetical protein
VEDFQPNAEALSCATTLLEHLLPLHHVRFLLGRSLEVALQTPHAASGWYRWGGPGRRRRRALTSLLLSLALCAAALVPAAVRRR